ncbi:MAG: type IV pilus biogenesis/stability protein PilW [Nitrosomonas sp.]|nr:type IV pilus biogenesis/stability protein PilW [Nitrosomonas sp.]
MIAWLGGCVQQPIEGGLVVQNNSARAVQSAKIHTELAAEYFHRNQFDIAIEEITEALKAQSNYAPAYNVLGLINMTLNDNNKALESFERAIRLAPKNSEIHNNFGWFLCQRLPARMDEAINYFMNAANDPLYPTPEMSYTNAGVCELKRQKYKEARSFLNKALSLQTDYLPAAIGLIGLDLQSGHLTEAKTKLSLMLQNNAPAPEILLMAVKFEQAMGNQLAADSYSYQLQKHFPESKEAAAIREGKLK